MDEQSEVYARFFPFLDRFIQLEIVDESLVQLSFPEVVPEEMRREHPLFDRIAEYLTGTVEVEFSDVKIGLHLSEAQQDILTVVRAIPYGSNATVEDILRDLRDVDRADEALATTVREALAANPVPIVIPDHRVRDGPSGAPPRVEQRLRSVEQVGG